jgi:predicted PurR-regulated permease PerM
MAEQQPQPTLTSYVKFLFSPTTLAALRYALAAVAPLVALFGVSGFTPDRINSWVSYAQTFGTAALAILALLGIIVPVIVAILGILSATIKTQIARVRELANNPQLATQEAAKALTDATSQLAKSGDVQQSASAVNALVAATIGLNKVQTIITDKATADASPSPSVIAATDNVAPIAKVAG